MQRSANKKHYFGSLEYNGSTLEALYHEEGRAVPDGNGGYDYEYAIRDHLGSTRVMFQMVNGVATLIEEHHNYPFGMELSGPAFVGGGNPYRYTGKEWETHLDLGMYDFGARWYDPAAGRWWGVDALGESYYEHSPFTYVLNNPVNFVDPDGNGVEQLTSTFVDRMGRVLEHRHDNDRRIYEVDDPSAWEAGGKTKDGLAVVGAENPNHTYVKGSTLDLNNRAHNALAPQSGALTPSYPVEELLFPMPLYFFAGKWIYWGGKWVFVQTIRVGGKLFVRLVEKGAVKTSSIILHFPSNQLQSKFKHAIDFGVLGNFNKANAAKFSAAINQHINATSTQVIHGAYRNTSNAVTFYLNPTTGLNVVSTRSGQFITGAKLSPAQINDILTKGFLW
ncbi:MAG: colicin D domain-containing protein [Bacteroidia bacterium]|nr:colicin D domain-containing protein [Bacteroidia bacterium]